MIGVEKGKPALKEHPETQRRGRHQDIFLFKNNLLKIYIKQLVKSEQLGSICYTITSVCLQSVSSFQTSSFSFEQLLPIVPAPGNHQAVFWLDLSLGYFIGMEPYKMGPFVSVLFHLALYFRFII